MVQLEGIARLAGHLLYGLVYNFLKANAFVFFIHSPPNAGVSANTSVGLEAAHWLFLVDSDLAILS